jgi:glycosyltransferase involved in cell wall biosynthesis
MKILLSCFAMATGRGSEPGKGWALASALAADNDVWALVDPHPPWAIGRDASSISRSFPRLRIVAVPLPRPIVWLRELSILHYAYYVMWQALALLSARRLHATIDFDVVHHVSYENSWIPSLMAFAGPPFVCSAGARERTPWSFVFRATVSWRGMAQEMCRNIAMWLLSPVSDRICHRRADLILTSSPPSAWGALTTARLPIGGLSSDEVNAYRGEGSRRAGTLRVASIGRLVAFKGFDLGLLAFAQLASSAPEAEYWIVGVGPERPTLERLARRLGCGDRVRFVGWMDRHKLSQMLLETDILLHPSLHEQLGYVILEAMAAGCPVVCLDVAGPPVMVGSEAGILVTRSDPEHVVEDLSAALRSLARDSGWREGLGRAGQSAVIKDWRFESVARRVRACYERISGCDSAHTTAASVATPDVILG